LQCQIYINLSSKQSITCKLKVGEITAAKTTQDFDIGNQSVTLAGDFNSLSNDFLDICLEIISEDNKLVYLQNTTLIVFGALNQDTNTHSYQATKTESNIILSYIKNNSLYYKLADISVGDYESDDFVFHSHTISYSYAYLDGEKKIYLFRVDTNKNLLFSEFFNSQEQFIIDQVSHVSACANQDSIVVSYIKNNSCYVFSIKNGVMSNHQRFNKLKRSFTKCFIYFNNYINHIFLMLTDNNSSNYLIETLNEFDEKHENIKAKYKLNISTYEVADEL